MEVRAGRLTWRGRLQPTRLSRYYLVSFDYVGNNFPVVRVLDPPLEPTVEHLLPHVFRDGTLCLHERHEWRPDMRLVETIIAWTCEWLYFYEIWLGTKLWFGDGDDAGRELHGVEDDDPVPRSRSERRSAERRQRRRRPAPDGEREGMTGTQGWMRHNESVVCRRDLDV